MLAWRKIISPKQVGHWEELLAFMGPERLAVTETGRRARLEIFDVSAAEAAALRERFGGEIRDLEKSNADWVRAIVQQRPISIRGRLLIHNAEPGPTGGRCTFRRGWRSAPATTPRRPPACACSATTPSA